MTPIPADTLHEHPLLTDQSITERMITIVGRAIRPQAWIMLLAADYTQLPIVVPVEEARPPTKSDQIEWLVSLTQQQLFDHTADHAIVVWERPGPPTLHASERIALERFAQACADARVSLRAQLLSSSRGVGYLTIERGTQ
ncbi:hypothetical protein [Lysinibacter cavernae]|uniref:Uncharacterized protein n=1 Tax=Lysinibacter cavernae TaxID=1640652 RepID=A0A7X5TTZ9_9MICO|nr:hypothetical protein [Lysinibacter cavernae]NIH54730.1 hypothetical protein [Lysinibacter cavernae]